MELRICCDASVKLERMSNVMKVDCTVGNYQIEGDTLSGDILISGNYIRDVMEEQHEFQEKVPFTLVFKDRNYQVKSIAVQDFTCQEIINQGIECNFNILVDYTPKAEEEDPKAIEVPVETESNIVPVATESEAVPVAVESEAVPVETQLIQDVSYEDSALADEAIKQDINQKYDNLLQEILEARCDENFLEQQKVKIRSDDKQKDCRSVISSIKEKIATFRVYYPKKEGEIESICRKENVSIDKVYKDNKNTDFVNKKRIILK